MQRTGSTETYRHLGQVSSEDAGDVVGCEKLCFPVDRFAVLVSMVRIQPAVAEQVRLARGGVSNTAWRSRIRLVEPLTRNVPSISVAIGKMSNV
jgi:hypothetical protein